MNSKTSEKGGAVNPVSIRIRDALDFRLQIRLVVWFDNTHRQQWVVQNKLVGGTFDNTLS